MLLKAAIIHRGGKIREPKATQTIGFDACVNKSLSDGKIKFLSEEQSLPLKTINGLRDAAQHHLVDISEQNLYMHAQVGVTLFRDILKDVFQKDLHIELPDRVLPISTTPPSDLTALFDNEINEIKRLLQPGTRRRIEASAKLRALAIIEGAIQGEKIQPTGNQLQKLGKAIKEEKSWERMWHLLISQQLDMGLQ
jgi:hypothetical protein